MRIGLRYDREITVELGVKTAQRDVFSASVSFYFQGPCGTAPEVKLTADYHP